MSSMRNAVQRRNHRERAQPRERQKWGILEKHKDYSLRARDFNAKKARLRALRDKAADRNPDEFHFGMMSSRTSGGIKVADRGNRPLSMDVVKLLKTQDAAYLRTMAQRVRREREKVERDGGVRIGGLTDGGKGDGEALVKLGAGVEGKEKVAFVESREEQVAFGKKGGKKKKGGGKGGRGAEGGFTVGRSGLDGDDDDGDDGDAGRSIGGLQALDESIKKKRRRWRESKTKRCEALKRQEEQLKTAEMELERQRAKMNNSIGGVNKNGVKFKIRERKR